ncbi:hypothetical protein TNCV_3438511 [Trichonephila clavipes]|nr:hypothetical protein TNCV_3438511 [Trichonephila clavipes]
MGALLLTTPRPKGTSSTDDSMPTHIAPAARLARRSRTLGVSGGPSKSQVSERAPSPHHARCSWQNNEWLSRPLDAGSTIIIITLVGTASGLEAYSLFIPFVSIFCFCSHSR